MVTDEARCFFCHKFVSVVNALIKFFKGYDEVYICMECIRVCASILDGEGAVVLGIRKDTIQQFSRVCGWSFGSLKRTGIARSVKTIICAEARGGTLEVVANEIFVANGDRIVYMLLVGSGKVGRTACRQVVLDA